MKRSLRRSVLFAGLLLAVACPLLLGPLVPTARATVDDSLTFALEAIDEYIKGGYTLREDTWGGDLPTGEAKAITHQLFKGNEYWFCMGTDIKGAKVSVHIYDGDGNLVEEKSWQKEKEASKGGGAFAAASVRPKRTGTYFLIVKVEKSAEERTPWGLVYAYK